MTVGIRDLKANLSRHLKRVQAGASINITDRGRVVATLAPIAAPPDISWTRDLVAGAFAQWSGGKPARHTPVRLTPHRVRASDVVLSDRR